MALLLNYEIRYIDKRPALNILLVVLVNYNYDIFSIPTSHDIVGKQRLIYWIFLCYCCAPSETVAAEFRLRCTVYR